MKKELQGTEGLAVEKYPNLDKGFFFIVECECDNDTDHSQSTWNNPPKKNLEKGMEELEIQRRIETDQNYRTTYI